MTLIGWTQILLFCAIVAALARPLGGWMTRVLDGDVRTLAAIERPIWRLAGTDPDEEQSWLGYAFALLAFNLAGFLALYALQRLQGGLPLNPAGMPAVPPALAFNTAVSFMTNTNWQNYGGETTMSHLTQMAGLTVQNFVSAATGIAVAVAVIRGFARASARSVGNFWVDLTRITLFVLLPISAVLALVLVAQGMPQTLAAAVDATTLEGARQTIATGPVASPGRDQDARHQRRRLLQRQRRASVREPDGDRQLPADAVDLRPRRGAHQRLRPHGRQRAPGLGDPRGDGAAVPRRRHGRLLGRGGRQPARPRPRDRRRQHGGQGGPLRHRDVDASSPSSPRRPPAARSTPCTTASPRSAA